MIPISSGVRVWIASGHCDMHKGMQGLALLVQEGLVAIRLGATSSSFGGAAAD